MLLAGAFAGKIHGHVVAISDVPGEVKVTGIDNTPFCEFCACPLTAVDQDLFGAGRLALRTLMDAIADPDAEPRNIQVEPILVQRRSTE